MAHTNPPGEHRSDENRSGVNRSSEDRSNEGRSAGNRSAENPSPAFGPTAYDVLGLEFGADAKAVRGARLKGMADPGRRSSVSRAANALARPSGRLGAALLTPLLGSLSEEELKCRVSDAARELLAELPPLLPEADRFGPFPRSDS